jgi:DNA polymerase-3 subunit alpha
LFNKDYENFRKYLYEGYSLMLKGIITENTWKNTHELELKIKSIHMLSYVLDELVKGIQIKIPAEILSDGFLNEFATLIQRNTGNTNLKVQVYDSSENIWIDMFSRSSRVTLSDEFVNFLTLHKEIEFKLV